MLFRFLISVIALFSAFNLQAFAEPIDIGSRLELFVDDYLIESMDGETELLLHHPEPKEIVLEHNEPWEGSGCGYHSIFRDGDLIRMYYKSWHLKVDQDGLTIPHQLFCAYAESNDAIHWVKPELGLFEFEGMKANNIVWEGPGSHDFTPFIDTNPACPSDERYKAVGRGNDALLAFVSADGIHWEKMQDNPILSDAAFDSENLAFWDSVRGEYRLYFRDFKNGRRDIMTATSKDFSTWSNPVWLVYPGAPDEQLYTNQVKPYYRAPHIFFGFPSRYTERGWSKQTETLPNPEHRKLRAKTQERYGAAVTDALFMSSRDGVTFRRWGEAFLRPGIQRKDNWAYGDNYIAWQILETPSSLPGAPPELSLFSTESYWTGTGSKLRRYTIRVDGFVSVHASLKGGVLLTKPLRFEGDRLLLNYSTSGAGSLKVGIEDGNGRAIPGYGIGDCDEMFGDTLEGRVMWNGGDDLGTISGKTVRLRIELHDADLYSFRFSE